MEPEVSEPEQFWTELQAILSKSCDSEDRIDDALREYLGLTTQYKGDNTQRPSNPPPSLPLPLRRGGAFYHVALGVDSFLRSEYDISRCSYKLFASNIFAVHADYVRRQIIYGLLQVTLNQRCAPPEDDPNTLHLIASFLLFDGRQNEAALHMMNEEGVFARLLELIQTLRKEEMDDGAGLHRLLMDLLYEMSRIQRVKIEDLVLVDDEFIRCLFDIIEDLSYDVTDPYHYPVIRVLLVLNEQFMISAHDPVDEESSSSRLTNKVIKILSMYGSLYKTFGENIILLINREAETSLQLLTLKLLYLIFTTPSTYEYFFTNDLHVLVDILIRNLLDLPEEASALRHTYLRVLYPLLAHTQLQQPPHYKRDEIRKLLNILVRGQVSYGNETEQEKILHFEDVDETTRRLVARCATVDWLRNVEQPPSATSAQETRTQIVTTTIDTVLDQAAQRESPIDIEPNDVTHTLFGASSVPDSPGTASPTRMDSIDSRGSSVSPESRRKLSAVHRLGMNLDSATSSSLSVQAVASQHEKPGIITPSRKDGRAAADLISDASTIRPPKIKPEPPKSRRWRGRRQDFDDEDQQSPGTSSDHNTIPEGVEINSRSIHTAPPTPAPSSLAGPEPDSIDRRHSTTTSQLAPPAPSHARRSVSNPPPAVPPPRRSAQSTPSSSHHRPAPTAPAPGTGVSKHGQKPQPPKTRRWGRGKPPQSQHGQTDSVGSGTSSGSQPKENEVEAEAVALSSVPYPTIDTSQCPDEDVGAQPDPFSPTSPTLLVSPAESPDPDGAVKTQPLSVEEAVQNVSLH
ncbi:hypothetical protein N7462_007933 [Penicillium macrosclerotiorum]|uniref:uncharacterized protein n=1 Tax=Penicillium macrosclerotiorum TaxID=303699 RepID=UPI0025490FE0|nr:uncharacterized protein N7462_007933 [Penicillium macrosclerotiorum]KAJ5679689.1 hypothetical protein N7462_007933 [Penicillium macrosclerotiorum]